MEDLHDEVSSSWKEAVSAVGGFSLDDLHASCLRGTVLTEGVSWVGGGYMFFNTSEAWKIRILKRWKTAANHLAAVWNQIFNCVSSRQ